MTGVTPQYRSPYSQLHVGLGLRLSSVLARKFRITGFRNDVILGKYTQSLSNAHTIPLKHLIHFILSPNGLCKAFPKKSSEAVSIDSDDCSVCQQDIVFLRNVLLSTIDDAMSHGLPLLTLDDSGIQPTKTSSSALRTETDACPRLRKTAVVRKLDELAVKVDSLVSVVNKDKQHPILAPAVDNATTPADCANTNSSIGVDQRDEPIPSAVESIHDDAADDIVKHPFRPAECDEPSPKTIKRGKIIVPREQYLTSASHTSLSPASVPRKKKKAPASRPHHDTIAYPYFGGINAARDRSIMFADFPELENMPSFLMSCPDRDAPSSSDELDRLEEERGSVLRRAGPIMPGRGQVGTTLSENPGVKDGKSLPSGAPVSSRRHKKKGK